MKPSNYSHTQTPIYIHNIFLVWTAINTKKMLETSEFHFRLLSNDQNNVSNCCLYQRIYIIIIMAVSDFFIQNI